MEAAINKMMEELVELRHYLHAHPETAHEEYETHKLIAKKLKELGAQITEFQPTGFIADFHGRSTDHGDSPKQGHPRTVLVRSDMDALKTTEAHTEMNREYRSVVEGRAHLCGHDFHMASLVGAATLLANALDRLPKWATVRFCLQPAEEVATGAARMIERDGVLNGVDECFGMHAWPFGDGCVRVISGPTMSQSTKFHVTIKGRGGHGSQPQVCVDPLVCACHVVTALQTVVSRNVGPLESAVVSVAMLHVGEAENVIAEKATLAGTCRTFTAEMFQRVTGRLRTIVEHTAEAFGCTAEVEIKSLNQALMNSPEQAAAVERAAVRAIGRDKVSSAGLPLMASEDFSEFARRIPSCFFYVGIGDAKKGPIPQNHAPDFDAGDASIGIAVKTWVRLLEDRFGVELLQ